MPTFDPALELWLRSLPDLGYDRMWVVNNIQTLTNRFRETNGQPMPPCPSAGHKRYDPYGDL